MYLLIFLLVILIICLIKEKDTEKFISDSKINKLKSNKYHTRIKIIENEKGKKKYFHNNRIDQKNKKMCKNNKTFNLEDIANFWFESGGKKKDCPSALIIASNNYNNKKKLFDDEEIDIGGLWNQGFYNISPRNFGFCVDYNNKRDYCCDAKMVQKSLYKPLKEYGNSYTCHNAPKKIPKGFVGEGNNNFIGKFCHVGGENFYKDKQYNINYGGKFQWSGGNCYKGCEYSNNSICNKICKDKYPFPYYYYNKFLDIFNIKETDKNKMESKALKISKDICNKVYN